MATGAALAMIGCSSTSVGDGTAAMVRFHEYRNGGKVMTIINESHTDRVEFYSTERDDASTKVASDELMAALLERIDEVDFGQFAQAGSAPASSSQWSQSIEVQTIVGSSHILVRKGIPADKAAAFRDTREAFLAIYNNIFGAQSVKLKPGSTGFEQSPAGK